MDHDQIYSDDRAKRLVELLRALAARIAGLERDSDLLAAGPELIELMGDARSELFHYEVRSTYDSPEVAKNRHIVDDAKRRAEQLDLPKGQGFDLADSEEDHPWDQ
jgi:hypothetical protein